MRGLSLDEAEGTGAAGPGIGPAAGPWLLAGHDGRLTVYVHTDGSVLRWTESTAGARGWSGPDVIPAEGITRLTVVQGANRYAHFLGRRSRPRGDDWPAVDIVRATQYQTGRPVTEWRSLGNPRKEPARAVEIGGPDAAVASDGALHICVPTGLGSLALRREDEQGSWQAWTKAPAAGVTDRPVLAAASTGLVEALVPVRTGALHLCRQKPGGPLVPGYEVGAVPLPGSVSALETSPGRLTYYLTDVRDGGVAAFRAGRWPVPLGGEPADGRISAVRTTVDGLDCTVLAFRGLEGTVRLGACATEDEQNGVWWTDTGKRCAGDPSLAVDGRGRIAVAVAGADGRPSVARQVDGLGLTLSDWQRI
ncbi:hypothetical protein AB0M42_30975 [Streptomyces sp. NPDC051784]|uniref:hypothetical protein n=1 Tax=Streptomyces sp. NPDC051784 TaxID=3155805 RepID=UPI00341E8B03